MTIVIHTIKGKQYAYDHVRKGKKVITTYLHPVGSDLKQRPSEHGGGRVAR